MRVGCSIVVLASLLVAVPGTAYAEPTAVEKETARNLVFEGRRLRKEGRTREAVDKFRAAHAIMHVPTTGIEVAEALVDLGLLVEARDALIEVSRQPPTPGEPTPFAQARDEAKQSADQLETRIPQATFVVSGAAGGSPLVVVDGTRIDPSLLSLPRKLNPGEHTAVASAPGRADKRVKFTLAERESKTVSFALEPYVAPPTPPPTEPDKPVEPAPRRTSVLVWAGFGTAVVGAAVGGVTGIISISKTSSVKSRCPDNNQCPPDTHGDLVAARTMATISNVAFAVAAVGAVVGVVGLFVGGPRDARATSARVFVGPSGVAGAF
jgi:hypothetical protein